MTIQWKAVEQYFTMELYSILFCQFLQFVILDLTLSGKKGLNKNLQGVHNQTKDSTGDGQLCRSTVLYTMLQLGKCMLCTMVA